MIRQAHRCTALSLLVAVAATLLLYQPDSLPTSAVAADADPAGPAQPDMAPNLPELTPGTPWIEPAAPSRRPVSAPRTPDVAAPVPMPNPVVRANPLLPRKAFTTVAPGERLADVARRVYGSTEAAERLWQANRDTLPTRDSPLVPGTLLRTP